MLVAHELFVIDRAGVLQWRIDLGERVPRASTTIAGSLPRYVPIVDRKGIVVLDLDTHAIASETTFAGMSVVRTGPTWVIGDDAELPTLAIVDGATGKLAAVRAKHPMGLGGGGKLLASHVGGGAVWLYAERGDAYAGIDLATHKAKIGRGLDVIDVQLGQ
jgi:hypothetical protein